MQYRTLTTIKRGTETLPPGTLLDLSDSEAAQLLESESIELAYKPFSAKINQLYKEGK